MPDNEILQHPLLHKMVLDLTNLLEVRGLFSDIGEND